MASKISDKTEGYRIGTVARLTGISPESLRVWERRYQVVTPGRTPSGDRYYSSDDVSKLKLIKRLLDTGDTISAVAKLGEAQLQERLSLSQSMVTTRFEHDHGIRVAIIGESVTQAMLSAREALTHLELTHTFLNMTSYLAESDSIEADVLIIELANLHADRAIEINDLISGSAIQSAIVVYRFASKDALDRLTVANCILVRAPVNPGTIQELCVQITSRHLARAAETADETDIIPNPVPERHFDDESLAQLTQISSTIKCECPQHLSELISSLYAFEAYSKECESRNSRDAALHNYLSETTSRARYVLEAALIKLIEIENIEI